MTEPSSSAVAAAAPATDQRFLEHLGSAGEMVTARRYREAEVEVLRALSIAPSELRALKLLALVRFKLGRLEEARAVCREIAATAPRDPQIRLKLGLIALKLDRVDESVQELETATRLAPGDPRAWSYLGYAYARRGEQSRAAAAFRRGGQDALAATVETLDDGGGLPLGRTPSELRRAARPPAADAPAPAAGEPVSRDGAPLPHEREPSFDFSSPVDARDVRESPTARERAAGLLREPGAPREAIEPPEASGPIAEPERVGDDLFRLAGAAPVSPLVAYAVSRLAPPSGLSTWAGAAARLAVAGEAFVRADAAVACTGDLRWQPAERRVRGRSSGELLGDEARPFFRLTGTGELLVVPSAADERLVPLALEDDILYVREDRVLAFEGTVSWEHGQIPRGSLRMLQFRGRGLVALALAGESGAMRVMPERPVFVSERRLLGWIGRVLVRGRGRAESGDASAADAGGDPFQVTCEGEGVVLLDLPNGGDR